MRRSTLALMGAAALLAAPALASAQVAQGTYLVPQPGGGTIQACATQVGSLPSTVYHPCHVTETLDATGAPHPVSPSYPAPVANAQEHIDLQAVTAAIQAGGGGGGGGSVPTGPAGTPNAAVVTIQGAANGAGTPIPTTPSNAVQNHADIQAVVSNTAFPGLGVTQLVPTTGTNSAPVALGTMPAGARAVRLYPETATGASVTIAWTRAASAAAAASQFAAGAYNTVSLSSTGPNWDESLTGGLNIYLGAVSGAATFAYQ